MTQTATLRRKAVTLVELLVVIALIILLAGLAVAVSQSGVFGSQKVVSAADRASGWLLIAKQRAMRDNLPRGVRFLLSPVRDPLLNPNGDPTYFASTEAQYIESPEPWVPNPNPAGNPNGPRIAFVYWKLQTANADGPAESVPNKSQYREVYYVGSDAELTEFDQRIVVGDYILFPELHRVCRIIGINNTTANVSFGPGPGPVATVPPGTTSRARRLFLADTTYPDLGANHTDYLPASPPASPPGPRACRIEYQFGFQPAPRPLIGEPTLQLTGGTVIDCRIVTTPNVALAAPNTTTGVAPTGDGAGGAYFDVLFAPSGNVMYTPGGIMCLWVRDPEKTPHPRVDLNLGLPAGWDARTAYDAAGEQALVTVYTHTGAIATHPPAGPPPGTPVPPGTHDPYRYAKDGINSGL